MRIQNVAVKLESRYVQFFFELDRVRQAFLR